MDIAVIGGYFVIFLISLYVIFYCSLYLRTSKNSKQLVGTSVHPAFNKALHIAVMLSIAAAFISLFALLALTLQLLETLSI